MSIVYVVNLEKRGRESLHIPGVSYQRRRKPETGEKNLWREQRHSGAKEEDKADGMIHRDSKDFMNHA